MSRPAPESPTIHQRLRRLNRHRGLALVAALAVLSASVPFILALPPLYRASATVLIESPGPGPGAGQGSADTEARLQTIKQEALTRTRLLGLVERFNLYPAIRDRVPPEVLMQLLQKDIIVDVKSTPQSSSAVALVLSYLGRDPQTVAAVANTLASYYVTRNDSIRTQQVTQTTKYLEDQIAETKKRLDDQAARMSAAARSGGASQQVISSVSSLSVLNTQLQQNGTEQMTLNDRRMQLKAKIADADRAAPDELLDPAGALLAVKQKELNGLLAGGARDVHPDVRRLRNEIADLQKTRAAARPSAAASPKASLEASLRETESRLAQLGREKDEILQAIQTQQSRATSAAVREPELQQTKSDYQSTHDAYDLLLKQLDQARLNERAATGDAGDAFRVIDPAVPPNVAIGPNRNRLLLVALMAALAFGLGTAVLADRFDTSFGSIDELRAFTRVPVLASIPNIATRRDSRRKWLRGFAASAAAAVALVGLAAVAARLGTGNEALARLLLRIG